MTIRAPRLSRAAIVTLAMLPLLIQCGRPAGQASDPAPTGQSPAPSSSSSKPSSLSRASLVAELDRAAAHFASGASTDANPGIAGRTFTLRLPFGCFNETAVGASADPDGLAHWSRSKDGQTIRLPATPANWTRSPLVLPPGAAPPWDKVDGFWIERPWMTTDACPARRATVVNSVERQTGYASAASAAASTFAPSPQTVGLAVILTNEGSRLGRQEPGGYSIVLRGAGDAPPSPPTDGYRLVLEGRIGTFPDGKAVRCNADSPDRRPTCVIATHLDVVALEDADGARLGEWRPG